MNKLDDLFSSKLAKHSTRPSERANELFLSRLAKQKKVVFWTPLRRNFAAAASLVLLGGLGYYTSLDSNKAIQVAQNKVVTVKTEEAAHGKLPIISNSLIKSTEPEIKNRNKTEAIQQRADRDRYFISQATVPVKTAQANTDYTEKLKSLSQDESLDFLNPKEAVTIKRPDTHALQAVEETVSDELKTNDDTFIIISPLDTYASNDVWEIPSILDQPSLENALILEDQQERLLTRIYDEVKQLKKGQQLDFTKFGFKSLEEMALSEEGFIVTETKKIKSKLQWLKAKIYN